MCARVATTQWSQVLAARDGSDRFNLGQGVRLQLIGSIFNVFDTQNITEVCPWVNGCGDEELGEPIDWQHPRGYELGVRVEF